MSISDDIYLQTLWDITLSILDRQTGHTLPSCAQPRDGSQYRQSGRKEGTAQQISGHRRGALYCGYSLTPTSRNLYRQYIRYSGTTVVQY